MPRGSQGSLFNGFVLNFQPIVRSFLVDVGSYCSHTLGIFSIMRYRSLRRFPVPLVTTGIYIYIYIPESVRRTLKVFGSPLGVVVRGGESERGRGGGHLVEGPRLDPTTFAPFWLPFLFGSPWPLKKQLKVSSFHRF